MLARAISRRWLKLITAGGWFARSERPNWASVSATRASSAAPCRPWLRGPKAISSCTVGLNNWCSGF